MGYFRLDRLLELLTSTELFLGILWAGLAALTVTLLVLIRTRWGQSRPLRKCLILSLLAHFLLVGYATTVQIASPDGETAGDPVMRVSLADRELQHQAATNKEAVKQKPWEQPTHDAVAQPEPREPNRAEPQELPQPKRTSPNSDAQFPREVDLDHLPLADAAEPEATLPAVAPPKLRASSGKSAEPIKAPTAQRRDAPMVAPVQPRLERSVVVNSSELPQREVNSGVPTSLLERPDPLPRMKHRQHASETADLLAGLTDLTSPTSHGKPVDPVVPQPGGTLAEPTTPAQRLSHPSLAFLGGKHSVGNPAGGASLGPMVSVGPPRVSLNRSEVDQRSMPEIYRLRTAPDRARMAQRHGATSETESAVRAGLKWLADNQETDGRWSPRRHEAGHEAKVAGRDRRGAGIQADTGMTGLALLAFLASGHTPRQGQYQETVQLGLDYLIRTQKSDGSLSGKASPFSAMYCHAMAAFAMSEAFAMTGEPRLAEPVRRAVAYTIAAQDPSGGGWRYYARDPGDTSQLGWQLMALKSAELAGIPIPESTRNGGLRFLKSVSSGRYSGLASYRVGEDVSRPMTAEALVCRQFLGMPSGSPTGTEAGDYLLGEMPGEGRDNLYYWYYGTLGMYGLQGEHWRLWNDALQRTLVRSQRKSGTHSGSWDPTTVWGGYGGRVYTTALATLCLEVYYRFLPLYVEAAAPGGRLR